MPPKRKSSSSAAKEDNVPRGLINTRRNAKQNSNIPVKSGNDKLKITIPNTKDKDVEVVGETQHNDVMNELNKLQASFEKFLKDKSKRAREEVSESSSSDSSESESDKESDKIRKLQAKIKKLSKRGKRAKGKRRRREVSSSESSSEEDAPLLSQKATSVSMRAMCGADVANSMRKAIRKGEYIDFYELHARLSIEAVEGGPSGVSKNNGEAGKEGGRYKKPLTFPQWANCFDHFYGAYMALNENKKNIVKELLQMITYRASIYEMWRKGGRWLQYDIHFRRNLAQNQGSWHAFQFDMVHNYLTGAPSSAKPASTSYGTNNSGLRVPFPHCQDYHIKMICTRAVCKYSHQCFKCKGEEHHPAASCTRAIASAAINSAAINPAAAIAVSAGANTAKKSQYVLLSNKQLSANMLSTNTLSCSKLSNTELSLPCTNSELSNEKLSSEQLSKNHKLSNAQLSSKQLSQKYIDNNMASGILSTSESNRIDNKKVNINNEKQLCHGDDLNGDTSHRVDTDCQERDTHVLSEGGDRPMICGGHEAVKGLDSPSPILPFRLQYLLSLSNYDAGRTTFLVNGFKDGFRIGHYDDLDNS